MGLRLSVGAACVLGLALGPGALAIAQVAPAGVKALTPSQLTYKKGPRGADVLTAPFLRVPSQAEYYVSHAQYPFGMVNSPRPHPVGDQLTVNAGSLYIGRGAALPPETKGAAGEATIVRPPEETAKKPADLLLSAIVTWLSTNFDLPANYNHPKIEFSPAKKIGALRFGVAGAEGQRQVMAVYVDRIRTIFLPQDWTGRTPAELSVLVHELVHHLQNLDKRSYDCPEIREKLAYEAQEKWLGLFGRSLLQDFQIDPLTLKVATSCMR